MDNGICVFCASSDAVDAPYFEASAELGRLIAVAGRPLVYGGGRVGLMGALARATHETGGTVIGVIPRALRDLELAYESCNELIVTLDLRERKAVMFSRSDAFIALPGGFGTLEEMVEVLTLKQLHMHDKAIVFLNVSGFYDPLAELFEHFFQHRFAKQSARSLYHIADTPGEAMDYIERYRPEPSEPKWY
ncbi:MAG: hypothetical protein AMXMBFR84_28530 [Candidatus Hydrogenedentota bacterium]